MYIFFIISWANITYYTCIRSTLRQLTRTKYLLGESTLYHTTDFILQTRKSKRGTTVPSVAAPVKITPLLNKQPSVNSMSGKMRDADLCVHVCVYCQDYVTITNTPSGTSSSREWRMAICHQNNNSSGLREYFFNMPRILSKVSLLKTKEKRIFDLKHWFLIWGGRPVFINTCRWAGARARDSRVICRSTRQPSCRTRRWTSRMHCCCLEETEEEGEWWVTATVPLSCLRSLKSVNAELARGISELSGHLGPLGAPWPPGPLSLLLLVLFICLHIKYIKQVTWINE